MSTPHHIHEPGREAEQGHGRLRWLAVGGLAYWLLRKWRRRQASVGRVDEEVLRRGHEPEDEFSAAGVTAFAAALLVMLVLVAAGALLLMNVFRALEEPRTGSPFAGTPERAQEHPLQADPSVELRAVRAREERLLNSYAWIDSVRGVARIPVDAAMDRLASTAESVAVDSVRLLTESGYVIEPIAVPAPTSPAYDVSAPEDFAVSPEIARILGVVTTADDRPPPD